MNKNEEIEDSLRFCREIKLYYKSGVFDNPRNIYDWEKYVPIAEEEVHKKHKQEIYYRNKELEEVLRYVDAMRKGTTALGDILSQVGEQGVAEDIRKSDDISAKESKSFVTQENEEKALAIENKETRKEKRKRKKQQKKEQKLIDDLEEEEEESFFKIVVSRFVEIVVCIGIALVLSVLLNKYVGTYTMVEGTSMESTLHDEDYLLVDRLSYRFTEPKRFDIVIFPFDEDTNYIKRIIGMPGEKIQIQDQNIYINGEILQESYGLEGILDAGQAVEEIQIGDNQYFVMGDNRNHSTDSRSSEVGLVSKDKIAGKAFFRFYPIENIGLLE